MIINRKKLIEVALPLEAINRASAAEKGNPFLKGHPRSLHQWWARRPLAAARAVILAQMIDDPTANPDLFPTEKAQLKERIRLFKLIERIVDWESGDSDVASARDEIWQSWRRACAQNADHPQAAVLFNRDVLPVFHDPFAGGGALPLEAQRLGLVSNASDLNPVAVLINKAMIEIPPLFADRPPVNPASRSDTQLFQREWRGARGLAEDVRYYSEWMRIEAEERIGSLYPRVEISETMVRGRPDLKPYSGRVLPVTAWIWARTVKSPNPAFARVDVPLASTFMLATKPGREAYIEPVVADGGYTFTVKSGKPRNVEAAKRGTKAGTSGSSFLCLMSGSPMTFEYLRSEAKAGRMGVRLMAIVAEGDRRRLYLPPTPEMEAVALSAEPMDPPEADLPAKALGFRVQEYGMTKWRDLFTRRQLVALTCFSDLVTEVAARVRRDAMDAGFSGDDTPLRNGGRGVTAYGEAVATLEALVLDKLADYNNTICTWNPTNQNVGHLFTKHAIPMAWDFPETTPFHGGLSFSAIADGVAKTIEMLPAGPAGRAFQHDCGSVLTLDTAPVVATDPPYYDNIGYADLSDFFYVWLRRSLRAVFPGLFGTVVVPKAAELVAAPHRHGSKQKAEAFFLDGMTVAMERLAEQAHPGFPVTIYYAFKQTESDAADGTTSTGWETFLAAVIRAGFAITGTWPVRTEREARAIGQGTNALASSIILVCRRKDPAASVATRREFVTALKTELPGALAALQRGNVAPVDLAQAALGPGMAVFTRYSSVLDAGGKPLNVRDALALINHVLDEALAEQEGDFDPDTRWALTWFDQHGFAEGEFGVAEQLSKSKNTSVSGMVHAGILASKRGAVRLLRPKELPSDWDPSSDQRLTVWETVHQLIRVLESDGESGAAALVSRLGAGAEVARELAYRLFTISDRKKRAAEALSYNGLVQSFPELERLAKDSALELPTQQDMLTGGESEE